MVMATRHPTGAPAYWGPPVYGYGYGYGPRYGYGWGHPGWRGGWRGGWGHGWRGRHW